MDSTLELQKAALTYIDQNEITHLIEEKCKFYESLQDKAFQFAIPIDPTDLLGLDAALGSLLLNQPSAATKIFQEVIFMIIRVQKLLSKCRNSAQVVVVLKLMALPAIPEYHLENSGDFVKFAKHKRFLQYDGIVCGMSSIHKYTKVARFVCQTRYCEGAEGDKYIRLHIPGAREEQTIRSDFTCNICGGPLEEDMSCRVLADKLNVELVDETAFNIGAGGKRNQSITTYIRDDLIHGIEIGQKLSVIGMPVLDHSNGLLFLEESNVRALSTLPACIRDLLRGHITPAGTYLHLKLGLLLSLVASNGKEDGSMDLLAVGSDTLVLHRLLSYAASLSPRCIQHTVSNPLIASVSKDRHNSDIGVINGGSMLLANGGICVIPHLDACKKQLKYSLLQALEKNKIMVEVPPKLAHQGPVQPVFLPRRCSVWSTFDPSSKQKPQQLEDVQVDLNKRDIIQSLADVFGMVYFVETPTESYADHLNTHQVLLQAMGVPTASILEEKDIKKFLVSARKKFTTFSEASERLIKGYYVASRTVRANGIHMWTLPITAVRAITALSAAHAKLCFREEVSEHDAVMAILLYEECVTTRSGQSVLGVKPLPHIKDNEMERYIGPERDQQLYQFEKHLKSFILTHAPDVEYTSFTEE